ncbi:hypothetical protein GCM10009557_09320 [Virgisporangium ochraceum]|uniref:Uncharacterized protein n=1 Tax=Virgisporangium ochraceum TaxID=65505 RepID=A0A8J3ZW20_9ACTN|nr:hypothetical protein Voc01_063360 [Virgisporangium ochraceum]
MGDNAATPSGNVTPALSKSSTGSVNTVTTTSERPVSCGKQCSRSCEVRALTLAGRMPSL